ncbi:MAG: YfiR/HmsC family protein [Nitrosomonas sp.]|nr:MAG: YfiR/HmsC family protein [Nitrosomonas sp.]
MTSLITAKSLRSLAYILPIAAMLFITAIPSSHAGTARDKVIAVYIFRLAEHVQWQNASRKKHYQFHIIDDDVDVVSQLRNIAQTSKLHDKSFTVTHDAIGNIPDNAEVVFIAKGKSALYPKVFEQTAGKNILLISDNLMNDRITLIDLKENANHEISFRINRANILNRNLGLNPDIILLGGAEIDVARLYKEGLRNLQEQDQKMVEVQQSMASLKSQSQQLQTDLSQARQEEAQLARKLFQAEEMINRQNQQIAAEQRTLEQKKTEVNQLKSEIEKIQNDIANKNAIIVSADQQLMVLEKNIAQKTGILTQKNHEIALASELLEKQGAIIDYQKNLMLLVTLVGILAILLLVGTFRGYRNKKLANEQLKQNAIELNEAKKIAEQHTLAKSMFLSNMSHELRSPLNSIIGFAQLINENANTPAEILEQSRIIARSGNYLLALINDVLEIAKIESGKIEFYNEDVDFFALIRDVENMSRIAAEKKGLNIIMDFSSTCIGYVYTDAAKLRQIFINLINNAIKYTRSGGVAVRIRCGPLDESNQFRMYCEVEDSGIGIHADDLQKIFQPFEQVRDPGGNSDLLNQGTGLGLSICKQLIESMHGSISVESTLGVGSIFKFDVAIRRSHEEQAAHKAEAEKVSVRVKPGQRIIKALIVEDLSDNELYLRKILEESNCVILSATNGKDAVKLFNSWQPDIIFMDRRMPVMDGIEATQIIRQSPGGNAVKIIAVTASVFKEDQQKIMQHGFDDFIRKPYLINEIRDSLVKHMQLEFVYHVHEAQQKQLSETVIQHIEDLQKLPTETKVRLRKAIMALELEETLQIIASFEDVYPGLAVSMTKLVEMYDFVHLQEVVGSLVDSQ